MKYELFKLKDREEVDLVKFEEKIISAVHSVRKDLEVTVYSKYYQIDGAITPGEARKIGGEISCTVPELRERVTVYESKNHKHPCTRKLFRRMKEEN